MSELPSAGGGAGVSSGPGGTNPPASSSAQVNNEASSSSSSASGAANLEPSFAAPAYDDVALMEILAWGSEGTAVGEQQQLEHMHTSSDDTGIHTSSLAYPSVFGGDEDHHDHPHDDEEEEEEEEEGDEEEEAHENGLFHNQLLSLSLHDDDFEEDDDDDDEEGEEHHDGEYEEEHEEEEGEHEDPDNARADAGAQAEATSEGAADATGTTAQEEDNVSEEARTFMEFTGSTDPVRAQLFLTATGGNLEEAVNLFLAGGQPTVSPPETTRASSGGSQQNQNNAESAGESSRAGHDVFARLEALATGSSSEMSALLAQLHGDSGDASSASRHMSLLVRSLMANDASGMAEFLRSSAVSSRGGSGFGLLAAPATAASGSAEQPGDYDFTVAVTSESAILRLNSLPKGQWDQVSALGNHLTRSVAVFSTYARTNLLYSSLVACLGRAVNHGREDHAVRVLQVMEACALVVSHGTIDLAQAETSGWFAPPRSVKSALLARTKHAYRAVVAPRSDVLSLRRMWRQRELARPKDLLTTALRAKASAEFLTFLLRVVQVAPSTKNVARVQRVTSTYAAELGDELMAELHSLYHTLLVVEDPEEASGSPKEDEEDEYNNGEDEEEEDEDDEDEARAAPEDREEIELYALCPIASEPSLDAGFVEEFHKVAAPALATAVFNCVARCSSATTLSRALEALLVLTKRAPSCVEALTPHYSGVIASAAARLPVDSVGWRLVCVQLVDELVRLMVETRSEGARGVLEELARKGSLRRIVDARPELARVSWGAHGLVVDGQPESMLRVCRELRAASPGSTHELEALCEALKAATVFEVESCDLIGACLTYASHSAETFVEVLDSTTCAAEEDRWRAPCENMDDYAFVPLLMSVRAAAGGGPSGVLGMRGLFDRTSPSTLSTFVSSSSRRARQARQSATSSAPWTASPSSSALKLTCLERLLELAQDVLSARLSTSFPILSHAFGEEGSVAASSSSSSPFHALGMSLAPSHGSSSSSHAMKTLFQSFKMRLTSQAETHPSRRSRTLPEALEFYTLPLSSARDLESMVLRTCGGVDAKHLEYMRSLVGRKIMFVTPPATQVERQVFLVTRFDERFGAHRLTLNDQSYWRVLSVSEYSVLERVFDAEDEDEIQQFDEHDAEFSEKHFAEELREGEAAETLQVGSRVAVWWEGSEDLSPGWRRAVVRGLHPEEQTCDVVYNDPCSEDSKACGSDPRVGQLVRLIGAAYSPPSAEEAAPLGHRGRIVRVVVDPSSNAKMIQTTGTPSDQLYPASLFTSALEDGFVERRPALNDEVQILQTKQMGRVTNLAPDDLSFLVSIDAAEDQQVEVTCTEDEIRVCNKPWCAPREGASELQPEETEANVPLARVLPSRQHVSTARAEHAYVVYLRPGASDVELPALWRTTPESASTSPTSASSTISSSSSSTEKKSYWSLHDKKPFRGQRVEGRFNGKSKWYSARIARCNFDGTVDLMYDDGDSERCVGLDMVVPSNDPQAMEESGGARSGSSSSAVLFDFRRVFNAQAGKTLFDALRRDDGSMGAEYNFVTRGFENAPDFYSHFASTLERYGAGTFAQFQTQSQAGTLFARIQGFIRGSASGGPGGDAVYVRYEPTKKAPTNVMNEILYAFSSRAESARQLQDSTTKLLPQAGTKALVRVGAGAASNALVLSMSGMSGPAWVPCTVLARDESFGLTCVVTDAGELLRFSTNVESLKELNSSKVVSGSQSSSEASSSRRVLGSTSSLRGGSWRAGSTRSVSTTPTAPDPARTDSPIELTRQFSAFGSSASASRRTVVLQRQASGLPRVSSSALRTSPLFQLRQSSSFASSLNSAAASKPFSGNAGLARDQPPKLIVEFEGFSSPFVKVAREAMMDDPSAFWCALASVPIQEVAPTMFKSVWPSKSVPVTVKWRARSVFPGDIDLPSAEEDQDDGDIGLQDENLRNVLDLMSRCYDLFIARRKSALSAAPQPQLEDLVGHRADEDAPSGLQEEVSQSLLSETPSALMQDDSTIASGALESPASPTQAPQQPPLPGRPTTTAATNPSLWINQTLSARLRTQLRDPLTVATRVLPTWVYRLPLSAPFLFEDKDRMHYLRVLCMGKSRGMAWLQDDLTGYSLRKRELAQVNMEMYQLLSSNQSEVSSNDSRIKQQQRLADQLEDEIKAIEMDQSVGALNQDLVKIDRAHILRDAAAFLEKHRGDSSEVIVQFVGETGAGEGVTKEFYGLVAAELQRVKVNNAIPMFCDPDSHSESEAEDAHLMRPYGLFPRPLWPSTSANAAKENPPVLERYRFLGRIMGQAVLDEKTVALPLAVEFFELLKGQALAVDSATLGLIEGDSFGNRGMIGKLLDLRNNASSEEARAQLVARLEANDFRFVDPTRVTHGTTRHPVATNQAGKEDVNNSSARRSTTNSNSNSNASVAIVLPEHTNAAASASAATKSGEGLEELLKRAPAPSSTNNMNELKEFIQSAFDHGYTSEEIEDVLERVGFTKLMRWKAMKSHRLPATQIANQALEQPDAELVPNGKTMSVTMENLDAYLEAVASFWTDRGVMPLIDATREGMAETMGTLGCAALLTSFSAEGLSRMICGEQQINWDESDPMLGCIQPKGAYNEYSPEIKMLINVMKSMSMTERSQFLSFCTALPRVPLSGLPEIKVFPPLKQRVTALILNPEPNPSSTTADRAGAHELAIGDYVTLAPRFATVEDAAQGPLKEGQVERVTDVQSRVRVLSWWYSARALRKVNPDGSELLSGEEGGEAEKVQAAAPVVVPKSDWFRPGDKIRSYDGRAKGTVAAWSPEDNTVHLVDHASNREFRAGKAVLRDADPARAVSNDPSSGAKSVSPPPTLVRPALAINVKLLTEQCEVVQGPPFFRPKATTCVSTLFLPQGFESEEHMMSVFRTAFMDAAVAGIHEF